MIYNKTIQVELVSQLAIIIPDIRKEIGMSQTELGLSVGLSRQMISLIERGVSSLSWNNYLAILMFFKTMRDFRKFDSAIFDDLYNKTIQYFEKT